jgi:hypothetical protein
MKVEELPLVPGSFRSSGGGPRMILYVLIILVLASFVIAFFSARTWHWGYVLLVEAIFLTTVGFFILAAETLRINAVLRSEYTRLDKQVQDVEAEKEALQHGTKDTAVLSRLRSGDPPTRMPEDATSIDSLENLDHQLLLATRLRGRVWRNVIPAGIDPRTGAVRVTFAAPPRPPAPPAEEGAAAAPAPAPAAPGIKADSVVYVFEDEVRPVADPAAPQQPPAATPPAQRLQYLGEFNVTQAAGQQATLQFVQPVQANDPEFRRLAASRGPWIIYETMPMDRYEILAGMSEEQLKQLLPEKSVNEYLRHGKEATADDDPFRKLGRDENDNPLPPEQIDKAVKVVYQRRLRDYAAEFDELWRRRVTMLAQIDATTKDIAQLAEAQKVANKLQAFRTDERQKLTTDLAGVTKEVQAIERHLGQVQQMLAKARQLTVDTMAQNRQLAAELAARQLGNRPESGAVSPGKTTGPLALGNAR